MILGVNGMREKHYLIDSNILIYHLRGNSVIEDFLYNNIDFCAISIITYIEVLSFNFQNSYDENIARNLLKSFEIIDINQDIAEQSIKNRKFKKIKLPDNIIASTSQVSKSILVTRNEKDFKSLDIDIFNPFSGLDG